MDDNSIVNTAVDRYVLKFNQEAVDRVLFKIAQGRKIIVFGANWKSVVFCGRYNINIAYYVVKDYFEEKYGKTYDGKEIRSIYDVLYEDPGTFYIVYADMNAQFSIDQKLLLDMGLKPFDDYSLLIELDPMQFYSDDVHTHITAQYELPGVKIFGNVNDKDAYRIVALGGSTTDPLICVKSGASWPQHLYDILQRKGIPSVVFNCGVSGFSTPREFIKLCRDGVTLSPDLVISYSGVNDTYPNDEFFTNRHNRPWVDNWTEIQARTAGNHMNGRMLYGLRSDLTQAESWVRHIRMMHGVCNELGIRFAGFFQSYVGTDEKMSEYEEMQWENLSTYLRFDAHPFQRAIYNSFANPLLSSEYIVPIAKSIKDIPYIFDGRHIYRNNKELLLDNCHTGDAGNHLIAQHIYKTLEANGYL